MGWGTLLGIGPGSTEERGIGLERMWCQWAQPSLLRGCGIPLQMHLSWSPKVRQRGPGQEGISGWPLLAASRSHFSGGKSEAQREDTICA